MYHAPMDTALLFQVQSFMIASLLIFGALQAKKRKLHVKIMSIAILWDIILILQIEFTRSAIEKASKAISNPLMLNVHVGIALTTVILYFIMIYTGRKVLKGDNALIPKHRVLGFTTLFLRIATFITSFWAA